MSTPTLHLNGPGLNVHAWPGTPKSLTFVYSDDDSDPITGADFLVVVGGDTDDVGPVPDEGDGVVYFPATEGPAGSYVATIEYPDLGSYNLRVVIDDEPEVKGRLRVTSSARDGDASMSVPLQLSSGATVAISVANTGGAAEIAVEDDGVEIVDAVATINFTGAGVSVTDEGGGVVDVDIPGGSGLALGETDTTAYRGDRGKTAFDHSQVVSGNPHSVTAAQTGADPAGTAASAVSTHAGAVDPHGDRAYTDSEIGALTPGDIGAQPVDSDLTAIAALTTTAFGRGLLELANAGAALTALGAVPTSRTLAGLDLTANRSASDLRTALGLVIGTDVQAQDADLAAIAALTTTTFGRSLLEVASLAALQGSLGVPSNAPYIDGEYHVLARSVNLGSTAFPSSSSYVPGANTLTAQPVEVLAPVSIDGTYFFGQASVASGIVRHGIYAASASTGLPTGNPLLTSPEFDMSSTGHKSATYTPVTLAACRYWCVTAANLGTLGWRGPDVPMVDMGHTPGVTATIRSFTASWTYSSSALPDVSAFSWSSSTSLAAPWIRWRTQL